MERDESAGLDALHALLPGCLVADRLWAGTRLAHLSGGEGVRDPGAVTALRARLERSRLECARRALLPLTISYPDLPVAARRDDILAALAVSPVLVLTGETGSGKTTQLPKLLVEAGLGRSGMIALTQPRRVAAVAMAARIRVECAAAEGVVAHSVRFDDRAGADTIIRVMTDGLLLAEAAQDPTFARYDAVVVDEAHERSLNIDLLLGLLRLLRRARPELKVVISSASIEAERFARYFAEAGVDAPVLRVSGRSHPVEVRYQPPGDDDIGYLAAALRAIRELCASSTPGDVLCFLPTERDILEARRRLGDVPGAEALPLFGRLSQREQARVFAPSRLRKVVLATNLAETSLTIPGIRYVVDTGLARLKRYQPGTRTERLPVEAVAQASCIQRAGRAGRTEPGVCIRLYAEEDYAARAPFTAPEILRSNLAGVALQCLALGLGDPESFPWLDAPSLHAWQQARLILDELGAFAAMAPAPAAPGVPGAAAVADAPAAAATQLSSTTCVQRRLSPLGRQLSAIPADPQVARILLAGVSEGVAHEACTVAAFLSVQDPRVRPPGLEAKAEAAARALAHEAGDIATVLRLWQRYHDAGSHSARARFCEAGMLGLRRMREWADVRHQLWQALRGRSRGAALPATGHQAEAWPLDRVHRAVLSGMLGNVLRYERSERAYRGAGDRRLHVHPGSALRGGKADDGKRTPPPPPWLVACEVVETSRLFARMCAPIDPEWVISLAGERVRRRHRDPHYHPARRQVVCTETVTWKGLPVRDGRLVPYERIDACAASTLFVREAMLSEDFAGGPDLAHNHQQVAEARGLRTRLRDDALALGEEALEAWYRVRLGLDQDAAPVIASSAALARFIAGQPPGALRLNLAQLVPGAVVGQVDQDYPTRVAMGGAQLRLSYRYVPGEEDDGATLELGEAELPLVEGERLDWLVPGWLAETVQCYLEQLPKEARRRLIPLAGSAQRLAAALRASPARGSLAGALNRLLGTELGVSAAFAAEELPPWLRLRLRVRAASGAVIYQGRDTVALLGGGAGAGDRLRPLRRLWEGEPGSVWPGDCPATVELHGERAATALVRARGADGLVATRRAVLASAAAAAVWHEDGLDALLEAGLAAELAVLVQAPAPAQLAGDCERAFAVRLAPLRRHLALGALGGLTRGTVRERAAWDELMARAVHELKTVGPACDAIIAGAAAPVTALRQRLRQGAKTLAGAAAHRLAARHLELLIAPGWWAQLPWAGLKRLGDYLAGLAGLAGGLQGSAPPAGRGGPDAQSTSARERLLDRWEEAVGQGDARWFAALGLVRPLRDCAMVREECLLAAGGAASARLQQGLDAIAKALAAAQAAHLRARTRLRELQARLAGLGDSPAARHLATEGARLHAALDDLGLGCDPAGSVAAVGGFADRAALLLGRG